MVSPAELNRLGRETVCGSLAREILLFQAETCGYRNALTDGPRILQKETMVGAGRIPIRAVVLNVGIAVRASARGTVAARVGCRAVVSAKGCHERATIFETGRTPSSVKLGGIK